VKAFSRKSVEKELQKISFDTEKKYESEMVLVYSNKRVAFYIVRRKYNKIKASALFVYVF